MNKKEYQKPQLRIENIRIQNYICGNSLNRVESNSELIYEGGGSGSARSRCGNVWFEDEE